MHIARAGSMLRGSQLKQAWRGVRSDDVWVFLCGMDDHFGRSSQTVTQKDVAAALTRVERLYYDASGILASVVVRIIDSIPAASSVVFARLAANSSGYVPT